MSLPGYRLFFYQSERTTRRSSEDSVSGSFECRPPCWFETVLPSSSVRERQSVSDWPSPELVESSRRCVTSRQLLAHQLTGLLVLCCLADFQFVQIRTKPSTASLTRSTCPVGHLHIWAEFKVESEYLVVTPTEKRVKAVLMVTNVSVGQ